MKLIPSFYEPVSAGEINTEMRGTTALPVARNADLLPFQALGGRRFEILTYLYFLRTRQEHNTAVTLVKSSGDKGRDVLIHCGGVLRTIVQCKSLEASLTRPALIRELVKLALFDRQDKFLPESRFDYQIWAPGGLSEPASALIAEWPGALQETEVKEAFDATVAKYKTLSPRNWGECRDYLLITFPSKVNLIAREGYALSREVLAQKELITQFFQVNVVFEKDDVAEALRSMGIRPAYDSDIVRILEDLEAVPRDARIYLGVHSFGLSLELFTLMTTAETKTLLAAALSPFTASHNVLLSVLNRLVRERVKELISKLPHRNKSFGMLLLRLFATRVSSRIHKTFTPKALLPLSPSDDDALILADCAASQITAFWDQFESVRRAYDPARDKPGSDAEYRVRIAEHATAGYESRDVFESELRQDFDANQSILAEVDRELLAKIPDRVMFLFDTQLPFDNPELLKLMAENFNQIELAEPNSVVERGGRTTPAETDTPSTQATKGSAGQRHDR